MPIIQSTCISNVLPIPNSAVPLPPYSLSCSTLSSRASAFFTRNSNPIFKPNYAPFLRTKPPRGARLVIQAAGTDYYKTLNVPRSATLQEIKSSYRKLARKVSLFLFVFCLFSVSFAIHVICKEIEEKGKIFNYPFYMALKFDIPIVGTWNSIIQT